MALSDYEQRLQAFLQRTFQATTGQGRGIRPIDLRSINDLKMLFDDLTGQLEAAQNKAKGLQNTIDKLDQAALFDAYVTRNIGSFKDVLISNVERAFEINKDLNIPVWKEHLINLILVTDDIFSVDPVYINVTNSDKRLVESVNVTVRGADKLGVISDYANAVKAARRKLTYGNNKNISGAVATKLWYNNLWVPARSGLATLTKPTKSKKKLNVSNLKIISPRSVSKEKTKNLVEFYWDIMDARLQEMGNKAPYWYLLNFGAVGLSSDKGGYAMPPIIPTGFIQKTELHLKNRIENYMISKRQKDLNAEELLEKYNQRIPQIKQAVEDVDYLLNSSFEQDVNIIFSRLKIELSDVLRSVKKSKVLTTRINVKLQLLATQIATGAETGKRIYLATSGGQVIKRRTIELTRLALADIKNQGGTLEVTEAKLERGQEALNALQNALNLTKRARQEEIRQQAAAKQKSAAKVEKETIKTAKTLQNAPQPELNKWLKELGKLK